MHIASIGIDLGAHRPGAVLSSGRDYRQDETTVQRRAGIPGHSNAIIIECGERFSTKRPDTFTRTALSTNFKPLAVRRRTIHLRVIGIFHQ